MIVILTPITPVTPVPGSCHWPLTWPICTSELKQLLRPCARSIYKKCRSGSEFLAGGSERCRSSTPSLLFPANHCRALPTTCNETLVRKTNFMQASPLLVFDLGQHDPIIMHQAALDRTPPSYVRSRCDEFGPKNRPIFDPNRVRKGKIQVKVRLRISLVESNVRSSCVRIHQANAIVEPKHGVIQPCPRHQRGSNALVASSALCTD